MATDRLYYRDSYLREFSATILETRRVGDATEVVLDRTAFYPEGGGQPADQGLLDGLPVVAVVEREGELVHRVRGALARAEVLGQVDWERRFDHMQQHSGQHVLSQAFERLLGTPTISFHMGESTSSVDLATPLLTSEQVESVEKLSNRVVLENRPILTHLVDPADLSRFDLRKATERMESVRVVEVADFDAIPCGGTHCRSTAEIGLIKVVRCERRGANSRVEFLCGWRALRDYQAKNETVLGLAAQLSVRDREVREGVERLLRESTEARHQTARLRDRVLDYQAAEMARDALPVGRATVVAAVVPGVGPDDLKHLAGRLTGERGRVALLAAVADRGHLVFARSEDLAIDAAGLLRRACAPAGGRGGGRPNLAQGGVPDPGQVQATVELALEELRSLLAVEGSV